MLRYLPLIAVIGLTVYCIIDILRTDRRAFRSFGKPAWLLVVLLPVIGAILWLALGRPRRPSGPGPSVTPRRPVAPDDDPEFLRTLDEQAWRAKRDAERAKQNEENGETSTE